MRFYISRIGGHLQELAVLALIFVPLDRYLNSASIYGGRYGGSANLRCYQHDRN
jgi:hypothetical protein